MRRAAILLAALSLAGAAEAQTAGESPRDKLVAAITAQGCQVNSTNNEAILAAAGIEPKAAEEIVTALIAAGEAEPKGEALLLKTEGCN